MSFKVPLSLTEWDLPRTFLALINTRSSDLAAGELGVSVATLKRRMARLEDVVGTKLYTGYENKFVLTDEGANFAALLFEVDDILSGIKPSLGSWQFTPRPTFSIWMMDVLFELFLVPLIQDNRELFNRFHLVSRSGEMPEISQTSQHDMTLAHYGSDSTHVINFALGVHEVGFAASPAYLHENGEPTRDNLEDHHLAFVSDYRIIRSLWDGMEDILVKVGSVIEVDSTAACHALAQKGLHFTLATQWSSRGNYEPCSALPTVELPVYLSVHKRFLNLPEGQEVVDIICERGREYFQPQAGVC